MIHHPSPNCGPRRGGARPDLVVLHYTGMESGDAALERLCDPAAEVSAHYLVRETGEVLCLVEEEMRAWHAGAGAWGAVRDVNSRSIGIELVNTGDQPFAEPQVTALEELLAGVCDRWKIPPERVIAHADCAPARKADPGRRFDWRRLAWRGLSVWPEPAAPGEFFDDAKVFGYRGTDDAVLEAFRQRFRPWATGPLEEADATLMADLAARWPVAG